VSTAAACGLRIGEPTGLSQDLADRMLRVSQTLAQGGTHPAHRQPTTESAWRTILLPDLAVEAIRDALRWQKEPHLRLGGTYRDSGLRFVGPHGRPLNPSTVRDRDHLPRLSGSACRTSGSTPPI